MRRDMCRVYVPKHAVALLDVSDTLANLVNFASNISAQYVGVGLEESACLSIAMPLNSH